MEIPAMTVSMPRFFLAGLFGTVALAGSAAAQLSFSDQSAAAGANVIGSHSLATDPIGGDIPMPDMVAGIGAGDFDNDGYTDFFFPSGGLRRDRLMINNGDGTFTNKAGQYGVADGHIGSGCSVADFDGDGWLDIFVASHGPTIAPGPGHHRLYHNENGTHFTEVAQQAGVNVTSPELADGFGSTWGDYDLDGDLDLHVTSWRGFMGPPSYGNRLFRNEGNGTFTDVTQQAGVEVEFVYGFSPSFVDMNDDRYPELLLVADFLSSRYFVNNGDGTLTDMTVPAGVGMDKNGMGSAVGDLNGDGLFDWYVTSIYAISEGQLDRDGNKLYINQGGHEYIEMAEELRLDDGGWGWGAAIVDLDHDADVDIIEVNGWRDPGMVYVNENAYVWINKSPATLRFEQQAIALGFTHTGQGRGLIPVDYDRDGDEDFLITSNREPVTLMRNDLLHGPDTNWAIFQLDTSANPGLAPNGWGTRVNVTLDGKTQARIMNGGCHYMGTDLWEIHVGLGPATEIDRVECVWTDGTITTFTDLPVNQIHVLAGPSN